MTLYSSIDPTAFASNGVYTETYGPADNENIARLFAFYGLIEFVPIQVLAADAIHIHIADTPTVEEFLAIREVLILNSLITRQLSLVGTITPEIMLKSTATRNLSLLSKINMEMLQNSKITTIERLTSKITTQKELSSIIDR